MAESSGEWSEQRDPWFDDGLCPWRDGFGEYRSTDQTCMTCPYREGCRSLQEYNHSQRFTKELEMIQMQSPWGRIRVWSLRETGVMTPTQEIFWADTYKQRRTEIGTEG